MLKGKEQNKETTLIIVRRLSLAIRQVKTQDIVLIHTKTMLKTLMVSVASMIR